MRFRAYQGLLQRLFMLAMLVLSVLLHAAVVGGIISLQGDVEPPSPPQAISVAMISPDEFISPQPVVAQPPEPEPEPEPEVEPEPEPEPPPPEEAPVVIEKPKPKPKPKPRPKPQPAPEKQELASQVQPSTAPVLSDQNQRVDQNVASSATPQTPRGVSIGKPLYPARALDLHIEGEVRVRFDIDADGRPENIEILQATPPNMFERAVRQAMRKWRYEPGKPYKGYVMRVKFRINGGASIE